MKIERALISVSDKTGLLPFAKRLNDLGVEILSTGGTAKAISDEGIPVIEISDYTNAPEMFDGRLKTIHPKVHGGLLYRRDHPDDPKQAEKNDIPPIDLLVVNLYPFEKTIAKEDVELEEAIENIDIGGPAMLRAASKNYKSSLRKTEMYPTRFAWNSRAGPLGAGNSKTTYKRMLFASPRVTLGILTRFLGIS